VLGILSTDQPRHLREGCFYIFKAGFNDGLDGCRSALT
jgi:hypothetical protein